METMIEIIIEEAVKIVGALLLTLIGVLGTWLTAKLAKHAELATVNAAKDELIQAAQQTVGELEQTMVRDLKAASLDGKLTEEEITSLGINLYNITIRKLSAPAKRVLKAACVDIQAVITSAAEDWINSMRNSPGAEASVKAIGFQPEG